MGPAREKRDERFKEAGLQCLTEMVGNRIQAARCRECPVALRPQRISRCGPLAVGKLPERKTVSARKVSLKRGDFLRKSLLLGLQSRNPGLHRLPFLRVGMPVGQVPPRPSRRHLLAHRLAP